MLKEKKNETGLSLKQMLIEAKINLRKKKEEKQNKFKEKKKKSKIIYSNYFFIVCFLINRFFLDLKYVKKENYMNTFSIKVYLYIIE